MSLKPFTIDHINTNRRQIIQTPMTNNDTDGPASGPYWNGKNSNDISPFLLVRHPISMLSPRPKIRLKNYPEIVPVHAITANPRLLKLPLANKSASVFPRASKVQANRV